jgi:hypothetical protein
MAHYEAIAIIAEGFAKLAIISVMLKRLTEQGQNLQHKLLSQVLRVSFVFRKSSCAISSRAARLLRQYDRPRYYTLGHLPRGLRRDLSMTSIAVESCFLDGKIVELRTGWRYS